MKAMQLTRPNVIQALGPVHILSGPCDKVVLQVHLWAQAIEIPNCLQPQ